MRLNSLYYMNRLRERELTEGWLAAPVLHDKCALIAHASPRLEMFKRHHHIALRMLESPK